MTNPTVCAVMLTKDRPAMARRAVECFRAQTYPEKLLIVYNNSTPVEYGHIPLGFPIGDGVREIPAGPRGLSIGAMRNAVNERTERQCVIIHWDDDDWSHPNRITEQVALLQASGADAVGYNELLFWRERPAEPHLDLSLANNSEAWLYTNRNRYYAVGTSLCYWRKTWERKPFADLPKPGEMKGEDSRWIQDLKVTTDSGMGPAPRTYREPPRLIARIHGGNTMAYDLEAQIEKGSQEWCRVPEFDAYCNVLL